ncbi:hypothetical protein LWI29_032394 [Acer saccharum]|uniref:Retrotransposon Copia-like N-terminal domain-containing protein n=1 Tax=Acer saccharum TaxID=4024 RepID=A0AA39VM42_ACESA|nr:hypothetical protein LWI29_032394 [Acer saccharum]
MAREDTNQKNSESKPASYTDDYSDLDHPYYLHHSDHPGAVLVKTPLSTDNYGNWNRQIKTALNAKNKTDFIDGSLEPPSELVKPTEFNCWKRCNDMVLSWIINSLEPEIANSVIYTDSAHELWIDLGERFSGINAP